MWALHLASVPDVAWSLERFGDRYLNRVYTDHEIGSCTGTTRTVWRHSLGLAARFAGEEAAIKVLRPGRDGLDWKSIEATANPRAGAGSGSVGEAERLATAAGISVVSVAVSHEGNMAAAVVAAICAEECPERRTSEGDVMEDTIRQVLAEYGQLPLDVSSIKPDADLDESGLTSHASVNVMLALEDAFDIEFPEEMLRKKTFESITAIREAVATLSPTLAG